MRANTMAVAHPEDRVDKAHLSAEQIIELVERGRRCPRYDEYIDHIVRCPVCRETYKSLLQAEATVRAARRARWLPALRFWIPAAAAAALIVFIGLRLLWVGSPAGSVALRQENGVWYEGATRLPEWASAAAAAFASPPDALTRDERPPAERAVRLLSPNPANAALESLTPVFRWQAVPDAVRYRARLERIDTGETAPLVVEDTIARLAPDATLAPGARYRLTLEALAAGEVAGEGLRGVYEFRTLTPDEQARLAWARANRQHAPRTCVALLYQLGFYADALEILDALPDDPMTQKWRTVLQAHAQ
ncbi:MAG: hypothetical protein WHS44_04140 [Fimbriimonadales bacterium]|nr:MAG: hypothetical protein KatS3mg018_1704 [Fimbriimonadales bacterium]